ncbi:coagulation factor V [Pristis pectinata]|uniref:coagulation factor V n=1 Tax=Pristis pectinata TaxID=685728 RepID=UPI00223C96DA|nr:coagulation factor V [Pristis pectinata]
MSCCRCGGDKITACNSPGRRARRASGSRKNGAASWIFRTEVCEGRVKTMKPCSSLLLLISCLIHGGLASVRLHHIAAVEIEWVYSKRGRQSSLAETETFQKVVYKEYHDSDFTREKVGPEWRGLLGPTLRAEVGDTLKIHFKNKAAYPFNIRPQGISDGKSADGFIHGGRLYFKSHEERIMPLQEHTYEWKITKEVGPTSFDPQCLTYTYSSDIDVVKDRHAGLIGTLLICKPDSLDESGEQSGFHAEFVLLFSVFDESESWYYENEKKTPIKMYSINGFTNGTLPELSADVYGMISWHLIGMSYGPEIFSVHFNGQVLLQNNHKVSSIGLTPGTSITAEMFPSEVGKWLVSSQVQHHRQAELYGYLNIKNGKFKKPSMGYHSRRLTGKLREYFIAAEEMDWNYASEIPSYIDSDFRTKYLMQGPNRIGKIYKKAKYVEYTDGTFTQRKTSDEAVSVLQDGIGVPVIRGEVKDLIKIHFKNKASRPYSIYPHGITISKMNEGVKYPGNSSDSKNQVEPDQTFIYTWVISEEDGPTSLDPRCLTRMYHSAVDITRDIASGLFGPLLICKGQSLDARNLQIRVDEEQRIIFAALDENQSWYIDENIQSCLDPSSVDPTDPEFYESNIMYTINGFVYESKEALPFCEGDVTYWHVFSIGSQDRILSINFHGHTFSHRKTNEDIIHLFPLSGETLTMQMDNSGEWLLRSLSTQQRTYGMRMRIKVYQCADEAVAYPLVVYKIEYEGDKVLVEVSEEVGDESIDEETLEILKELGLRSFRKPQEPTEEDILQYIEDDGAEGNTVTLKDENPLNVSHLNSNGNQSKTSINANKPINSPNEGETDDLDYYIHEADKFEESVKLNERSTVEPTKEETLNEMAQITETSVFDSQPLNFTSTSTHLNHNMQGVIKEDTSLEISAKDYNARNDSSVLQDAALRTAANDTTFISNMDILVNLVVKNKGSLADIPVSTLKQSNNFQITAESTSYINNTNGKGEEEYALVTRGKSSEINNQGKAEDFIKQGNEDAAEVHTDSETGGKQETEKEKGGTDKTGAGTELGLIDESLSLGDNQAIEPEHSPDLIQHAENKTITNNDSTIEATTDSEKNNSFRQASSEAPEHFTSTLKESSMESSEDPEKVFIFLKKHLKSKHRVRFQGAPLKPKGHHLTYQVEDKGTTVSKIKSLKRYIKGKKKNNSKKQHKTAETTRRQAAAEMMLKHRKKLKKKMSPRGLKHGIKQRTNIFSGKKQKPSKGFKPKHKDSVIYQDDASHSIIVGIPKRSNGVTLDYDEYIANVEVNPLRAALEKDEEETDLDFVSPYSQDSRSHSDMSRDPEMIVEHYLRSHSGNVRRYFIAAEEVHWDYTRNAIDLGRSAKQRNTQYKKVIFRRYTDALFRNRYDHGERDDHLGILGPVIRAEVNDVIKVTFKNLASRPYSIHAHGVTYEKSSEGMSYEDFSTDWFKSDDAVLPNTTYTYVWNVPPRSGPTATGSICKPWVYYSSVDFEKDIHSGLIGPLLICKNGTLTSINDIPKDAHEFILLFNTFDETKSWYFNDNKKQSCDEDCEMSDNNSDFIERNTFHAINGFVDGSLRGLVMFEKELVHFYLINMGSSEDAHSIHLDGHTFIERRENTHRLGIYSLYPGAFRTVELHSSKPGIWLLDCENGEHYKGGMQAHLLVLSKDCDRPLGMVSGSITDPQITASDHVDDWEPKLARLHNSNRINAWSAEMHRHEIPWIQVDLERPMVLTEISTQGASVYFVQYYITAFYIKYSVDGSNWKYYNGNSRSYKQIFNGNSDSSGLKFNKFNPPIIARYLKLYPTSFKVRPTLRMELYGCEIDYCSQPLGMGKKNISDDQITASSFWASWWGSWSPALARLDLDGRFNAWRPYELNENQWLQVNFRKKMKITGIITQGAKSFPITMFVQSYAVHFSDNGKIWIPYTDQSNGNEKIFIGNTDHHGHRKNYINPPISATYIRIIPKTWYNSIALRVEFLGCALK